MLATLILSSFFLLPPSLTRGEVDGRPPVVLAASSLDEAGVFARLARIQSLAAHFVQWKKMRIFAQPQKSEGRLTFTRNGALVWAYTAPQRSSLTVEKGKVTLSYPDLGRTEAFDLASNPGFKSIIDSMFLWLAADPAALRKDYEVVFVAGPSPSLVLTPRGAGMRQHISSFTFTFSAEALVEKLVILEPDGDNTEIRFTHDQVVNR